MIFDNVGNKGKNNRIDSMPEQFYGGIDKERIKSKLTGMVDSGVYSYYRGNSSEHFWGGPEVKKLEKYFEGYLGSEAKCLAVNSCTSALIIACAAIGIEPGDEVIVSPWSMVCSATAPMHFGGIPVFADIGEDFCLDPDDIERKITEKTKAIIVVDLFGRLADYKRIMEIADKYNLYVIEDAAQAIGAINKNGKAGTFGDIGCFSFTQGKHMTAGEGGMIVTKNPELYARCALIRNHAEAVTNEFEDPNDKIYSNLIGFNFRMTELQAAILIEQVKNIETNVDTKRNNIKRIMADMPASIKPWYQMSTNNSFYVMPLKYTGKDIKRFVELVRANLTPETYRVDRGVPVGAGYIKPLYKFPCFQLQNKHWSIRHLDYSQVKCENAEQFNYTLIVCLLHSLNLNDQDVKDIQFAFKVADRIMNGEKEI